MAMQTTTPIHRRIGVAMCQLRFVLLLPAIVYSFADAAPPPAADSQPNNKWEKDIAAFEAQDAKSPPPKNGVVFVGSSSIRLWDLKESFPDIRAINRGFGGSELADSVHFARRIVIAYQPRVVVLYAGDNDVANGKTPERILADFQKFVEIVQHELPKTKIVYISIKPSIKRWGLIDKIRAANRLIDQYIKSQKSDKLEFVDVEQLLLGADGKPRADLLQEDGLHLNKEGYKVWAKLLRTEIQKMPN
jgi:lysophospholipase L1-like esterase